MRRVAAAVGVVVLVVLAGAGAAAGSAGDARSESTARSAQAQHGKRVAKERASQPCQDSGEQVASQTEGDAGWDPIYCWGCPSPEEDVGGFLLGLIVSAPICFAVIRMRTRRGEAQAFRRILEL